MAARTKRQPDSQAKNTSGQTPTTTFGRKRNNRVEFSDNDDDDGEITEDEQDEEPLPDIRTKSKAATNVPSTSRKQETGLHYETPTKTKRIEPLNREDVTVDDIVAPKKKVPPKSLIEQIFSPVFMCQLVIVIICVIMVNYWSASVLTSQVHVSDTSYRSNDKDQHINIESEVQKAINDKINKADIGGKVNRAVDNRLTTADIDSRVNYAIDIKLPKALKSRVPDIVREEAESTVKGPEMISVIKEQVTENSGGIKNEIEQSLSSKIVNALGTSLDKEVATLEEAVGGIAEFKKSLTFIEQKQSEVGKDVSELHDNARSASESLKGLSEDYSKLTTMTKLDSDNIDNLQNTIQIGEQKLKDMDAELKQLKETVSDTKHLYEEYKDKVLQLDDIRSKLDVIQPNIFNKDSFIMAFMILIVMVFVLAISVYNLYQRSSDTISERTGGRTAARHQKVLNNLNSHEVLKHIPRNPDLEPGVCIISFDESRTKTHKRILDTANIPNCRVQVHVVRRHEHIPHLPRCKVYLMCTEFSERHVIIEEPGIGLGDLHKTTYDAVLKLGGYLIILYTRDPESRNLKDDCRYNPKIYCVAKQQELSVLNQDGRFFSVYDKLTQYQKTELRKQISENMT